MIDFLSQEPYGLLWDLSLRYLTYNVIYFDRVTAKVDMMKMYGCSHIDGKMPLMITSQDERAGWYFV